MRSCSSPASPMCGGLDADAASPSRGSRGRRAYVRELERRLWRTQWARTRRRWVPRECTGRPTGTRGSRGRRAPSRTGSPACSTTRCSPVCGARVHVVLSDTSARVHSGCGDGGLDGIFRSHYRPCSSMETWPGGSAHAAELGSVRSPYFFFRFLYLHLGACRESI
jgi:hypothetical protein